MYEGDSKEEVLHYLKIIDALAILNKKITLIEMNMYRVQEHEITAEFVDVYKALDILNELCSGSWSKTEDHKKAENTKG